MPPVILLLAIVAMAALHFAFPYQQVVHGGCRFVGLIPAALGLGLNIWSSRLFERRGTAILPTATSTALVIEGPFRFSRNPMYLGMAVLLAGVAIGLGSATPWIVLPVFIAIIQRRFILMEERKMASEFGAAYADYRQKVRRWI